MNPRLFQQIATKLNHDPRRQNGVTAELVATVASDGGSVSHPIHAEIRSELKCQTIKTPKTKRPKNAEHPYLWVE